MSSKLSPAEETQLSKPFPLQKLPAELRVHIYSYLETTKTTIDGRDLRDLTESEASSGTLRKLFRRTNDPNIALACTSDNMRIEMFRHILRNMPIDLFKNIDLENIDQFITEHRLDFDFWTNVYHVRITQDWQSRSLLMWRPVELQDFHRDAFLYSANHVPSHGLCPLSEQCMAEHERQYRALPNCTNLRSLEAVWAGSNYAIGWDTFPERERAALVERLRDAITANRKLTRIHLVHTVKQYELVHDTGHCSPLLSARFIDETKKQVEHLLRDCGKTGIEVVAESQHCCRDETNMLKCEVCFRDQLR